MNQQSSVGTRLPDFIIGGAPKCGTTSLHFILAQNPSIGMPDEEIHYFDADDPIVHPDFMLGREGRLDWFDVRPEAQGNLDWYASRFARFSDRAVIGEDSTTYIFSEVAAERINTLLPDSKMIFLLRDPVKRAYSQYWHLFRSCRTYNSFEAALSKHPSIVLGSTYAPHLRRYFDVLGKDRVKVILFEEFLKDQQSCVDDVCDFIGAPRMQVVPEKSWFNKTYYPTWTFGQKIVNAAGGAIVAGRYRNHTEQRTGLSEKVRNKVHYYWFEYINPIFLRSEKAPKMSTAARDYLRQHLSARNAGLSEMLGRDLGEVWPGFEG
ncbi:MAG: sulfotransferase [Pseudomonadota bacterium]